ncbi:MAG: hypothetical protein JXA77_14810 [Bacteroidales bacterium]|nr:hypothetical protein [Bacteroidales bacterium]MBN2818636.1 hypothetical protein [Bacteroidales bacterium]
MKNTPQNQIAEIKEMMEKSSRFLSLSGLSGISVGLIALLGTIYAFFYLNYNLRYFQPDLYFNNPPYFIPDKTLLILILDAVIILILALISAIFFTARKARKKGLKIWNRITKQMLTNLFIPLAAGGIFCLALIYYRIIFLVAPATLIFYGLALINASKYTFTEIRWLGLFEIGLGLIATAFAGYGLIAWSIGFGLLHIIYGIVMYRRYDSISLQN